MVDSLEDLTEDKLQELSEHLAQESAALDESWWRDCKHEHTVVQSRGSMRFDGYGVDDNLTEVLVCTDCGAEIG